MYWVEYTISPAIVRSQLRTVGMVGSLSEHLNDSIDRHTRFCRHQKCRHPCDVRCCHRGAIHIRIGWLKITCLVFASWDAGIHINARGNDIRFRDVLGRVSREGKAHAATKVRHFNRFLPLFANGSDRQGVSRASRGATVAKLLVPDGDHRQDIKLSNRPRSWQRPPQ